LTSYAVESRRDDALLFSVFCFLFSVFCFLFSVFWLLLPVL